MKSGSRRCALVGCVPHQHRGNPCNAQRQLGFTFVELMVTLGIMAVLALVAVPFGQMAQQREREKDLRVALLQIREAIDAYKRASDQGRIPARAGDSGYPKQLEDLWRGLPDARSAEGRKLYFLRRLPPDPMAPLGSGGRSDGGWGLRSYASEPHEPRDGDDVFDIYSTSDKVGLNGVPYRQW